MYPLHVWLRCFPRCPGWIRSFCLFLAPVCPSPTLRRPRGSLRRFHPPGVTPPLRSVNAPWQIDSSSHSLSIPPRVFCQFRGLGSPLSLSNSGGITGRFPCRLATLSLSVFFALWCPPLQLQPIPFRLRLEWRLHRPLCLLVFLRAASL